MKSKSILFGAKTLPFLFVLLIWSTAAQAQKIELNKARNLIWVTGGGGISNLGGVVGVAVSHQFGANIISGRFIRNYDMDGGGPSAWDAGALYGRSYKTRQAMISAGAGVAYVGPSENGTVGLPLESQIFWTPTNYFGVGLYGFGNINSKQSFGGVLLGIQIGRVNSPY